MNCNRKILIEHIIEMIKSNEIGADGKFPSERDLAALLDVSRTTLREALIALDTLGVIEMRGKEGIFLINRTSEDIKKIVESANIWPFEEIAEIMQIRLLMEPNLIALAALNRTEPDIERLRHCLSELSRADENKKADEAAYWNTVLHALILKIANNNTLFSFYQHIFKRVQDSCHRLRIEIVRDTPEFTEIILEQHRGIVNAIINQDHEEGKRLGKEHILHTISGLKQSSQIIPFSKFLLRSF